MQHLCNGPEAAERRDRVPARPDADRVVGGTRAFVEEEAVRRDRGESARARKC